MYGDEREPVLIALTEDQHRQVFAAIGKNAIAVEVGSESEGDDWVVLVLLPAEPLGLSNGVDRRVSTGS